MQWGDWSCIRCAELPNRWRCELHDYAEDAADFAGRVPYCAQLVIGHNAFATHFFACLWCPDDCQPHVNEDVGDANRQRSFGGTP
jgi:hypothetical protein